jgi:hypothetical protein
MKLKILLDFYKRLHYNTAMIRNHITILELAEPARNGWVIPECGSGETELPCQLYFRKENKSWQK